MKYKRLEYTGIGKNYKINIGPVGPLMKFETFFEWADRIKKDGGIIYGAYIFLIKDIHFIHNVNTGVEIVLDLESGSDYHPSFYDKVAIDLTITEVEHFIRLTYRHL